MTYADDVRSQRSADRVDLYRFDGPQIVYAYTSGTRAVTVASVTYTPLAGLRRSALGESSSSDKATLTVSMSGACDLASDYAYTIPPRSLRLRVYEYQRRSAEAALVWDGDATAIMARGSTTKVGKEIEVRASGRFVERIASPISSVVFVSRCQHILGDTHCRVDMDDVANTLDAIVSAISSDGFTVTVDSIGAFPDDEFKAGQLIRDADGERRTITRQVGAVLTLNSPFRLLAGSNAVTLKVGCSKLVSRCDQRFGNVVNFGGHPTMPASNPFIQGVELTG